MERNVSFPSPFWARNMTAAPQRAAQMDSAGVLPQRTTTRTRNMAFVPAEVCDREKTEQMHCVSKSDCAHWSFL